MLVLGTVAAIVAAVASVVPVGPPELVNRNSAGEISSYPAYNPSISGTGRYVLFESAAPELHAPGVHYGGLYLRDRRTGRTTIPVKDRRGRRPWFGAFQGSI